MTKFNMTFFGGLLVTLILMLFIGFLKSLICFILFCVFLCIIMKGINSSKYDK